MAFYIVKDGKMQADLPSFAKRLPGTCKTDGKDTERT